MVKCNSNSLLCLTQQSFEFTTRSCANMRNSLNCLYGSQENVPSNASILTLKLIGILVLRIIHPRVFITE